MPIDKVNQNGGAESPEITEKMHISALNGPENAAESGLALSADAIRKLATDLIRTHGEQFSNIFGISLFGAKTQTEEERKKERAAKATKAIIQRVLVKSQADVRELVTECLHPLYQRPDIISALTQYLCSHYEMLYQTELPVV